MYALQIATFGDPAEVVELVALPEPDAPGAGDVLVAVEYAPINISALLMIRDQYGVRPALSTGVGKAGVGGILAVGGAVNRLHVGDRVLLPHAVRRGVSALRRPQPSSSQRHPTRVRNNWRC